MKLIGTILIFFISNAAFAGSFTFTEYQCSNNPLCTQALEILQPKAWTPSEINRVQLTLEQVSARYPQFMAKIILGDEPIQLQRVTQGVEWDRTTHSFRPYPYFAQAGSRSIVFTDQAFVRASDLELFLGTDVLTHTIVHELSHLFDTANNKMSYSPDFANLTHWIVGTLPSGGAYSSGPEIPGLDDNAIAANNREVRRLFSEGRWLDGFRMSHEFGVRYSYPSSYAMANPSENFAELVAWIYHDVLAQNYLSPAILTYMKENVLK